MARQTSLPLDFSTLRPPNKPRWCLVLPEGFESMAEPHLRAQPIAASPAEVLSAFREIALRAPRTRQVDEAGGQIELAQTSAVWRFTDRITVEAMEISPGMTALAIYSRAVLGYYDFGVNRKRVSAWLDAFYAAGSAK